MRGLVFCAALLAALPAMAQHRVDARQLDCASIQSLIVQRGAVVLTTGQHTYDRYVADGRFCFHPEVARLTSVPAADTPQCPVYGCGPRLFDHWDD